VARAFFEAPHHARRGQRLRRVCGERRHAAAPATAVSHTLRTGLVIAATMALLVALPSRAGETVGPTPDDLGEPVTVKPGPCRFVSLAPGTTAMLFAAGAAHCLVGTIAHSTEPAAAAKLPIIGDAETLDFEQLLALRPTAVVVAVDVVQRMRIDRIKGMGIPVYQVHVTRLAGMAESIRRLGALAGTQAIADREADDLRAMLETLGARYRTRTPIRVLYQIWDRPIYTIGGKHVITDALQLCGAINIFSDLATAAPAVTREAAVLRDPELILASAPPGASDEWLAEWRRFPALAAVKNRQLINYVDERIDRMGPSVIEATGNLCAVIDNARAARVTGQSAK
jgi:iron complex transport system substrate-binding protein